MKQEIKKRFHSELKGVAILNGILKLCHIPAGILTARLLSSIVSGAGAGDMGSVLRQGMALFAVIAGMLLLEIWGGTVYQRRRAGALHRCKLFLYGQLAASPLASLDASGYGDARERLNDDFGTVTDKMLSLYPELVTGILTFIAYTFFLWGQSWQAALPLLGMSLLQMLPPLAVRKFLQVNYDNCRDIEAQLTDFVQGGCEGFLTIKMYGLKDWWLGELKKYHVKYRKVGASSIYTGTAESVLEDLAGMMLTYGTYGILGLLVLGGYVPLNVGVQAIALSGGLFGAARTIFSMFSKFGVARTAQERLGAGLFSGRAEGGRRILCADVKISDLAYSYGDKEVLNGVCAFLGEGQTVVIKGPNGEGKSTLLKLVAGMLRCREGKVEIGGVDSAELSDESFPQDIFYLPQQDESFHFSAAELYKMSIPGKACEAERIAGEFGLSEELICSQAISSLSGGERKKVFLALAFAVEPLLMLLDEPTNSLDEAGRRKLLEMVKGRRQSTIIITHDTIFDNVLDMEYRCREGRLLANGGG